MIEEDVRDLDRRLDRLSSDLDAQMERLEKKIAALIKVHGCPEDHSKLTCYDCCEICEKSGEHAFDEDGRICNHCGKKKEKCR